MSKRIRLETKLCSAEGNISLLKPIVRRWFDVLQDYCERVPEDRGWWYGERPQVGFLSVAAWRANAVALEEWGTTKGTGNQKSRGRNDLWIGLDRRLERHAFFIEAKHCWCDIHLRRQTWKRRLENCVAAAQRAARRIRIERDLFFQDQSKVAAVFVTPFWNETREVGNSRKAAIKAWRQHCLAKMKSGLVALVVDRADQFDGNQAKKKAKQQFIGLALFLYEVGKRARPKL